MKLFFSEYPADYQGYKLPYQIWLIREPRDSLGEILGSGFLPTRLKSDLFYLGRSLRVNLARFALGSENKRVLKKTKDLGVGVINSQDFHLDDSVLWLCLLYSQRMLKGVKFSSTSIKKLFSLLYSQKVFVWRGKRGEILGYSPLRVEDKVVYYWYGFYQPEKFVSGLGMRMILEVVLWAKKKGMKFVYLGTGYTPDCLYKTQFQGIEFFNGWRWSGNLEELKYLIKKDENLDSPQLFKDQVYWSRFYKTKEGLREIIRNCKLN